MKYSNTRKSIYSSQDSISNIESMENYSYKTKSVLTSVNSKEIISDLEADTKICNWLDNMNMIKLGDRVKKYFICLIKE